MNPVQLHPVATTVLVAFYLLSVLVLVALLVAVAVLIFRLNAVLEEIRQKADPILDKLDAVLTVTSEKVTTIGDKAETILTQGEELTGLVQERVDRTTQAVQQTVFTPLIGFNSLLSGVQQGFKTFARRQQQTLEEATVREKEPVVMRTETVPVARGAIVAGVPSRATEAAVRAGGQTNGSAPNTEPARVARDGHSVRE